jgi:hypothetical protein
LAKIEWEGELVPTAVLVAQAVKGEGELVLMAAVEVDALVEPGVENPASFQAASPAQAVFEAEAAVTEAPLGDGAPRHARCEVVGLAEEVAV